MPGNRCNFSKILGYSGPWSPQTHYAAFCSLCQEGFLPARAPAAHILFLLHRFLLHRSLLRELKFKLLHSHFSAAEFYSFHFQAEALVESVFTGRGDPSARRHDSMPGQTM